MPEISLPKQLSGPEALDSMLFELRKRLRMNGRFQPHMAYAGYKAVIDVKFYPAASFIPPVEQTIEFEDVPTEAILSQTATVEDQIEIPVRPPNQVREDSDMPTPVLTQDEHGQPVERWVKRAKQPPKNKVKGGQTGPMQTMVPTAIPVSQDAAS